MFFLSLFWWILNPSCGFIVSVFFFLSFYFLCCLWLEDFLQIFFSAIEMFLFMLSNFSYMCMCLKYSSSICMLFFLVSAWRHAVNVWFYWCVFVFFFFCVCTFCILVLYCIVEHEWAVFLAQYWSFGHSFWLSVFFGGFCFPCFFWFSIFLQNFVKKL